MEEDLIQIYKIESETKVEKLFEELKELTEAIIIFQHDQNKDNLIECLKECFDVLSILCQLGIVRYGLKFNEIKAMAIYKVKLVVSIGVLMKKESIGYKEARGRLR